MRPVQLEPLAVLPYTSGRHQGVNFVFGCAEWAGEVVPQPEAFDDLKWVAVDALPERVVPWLVDVLALEAQGGWFRELRY